MAEDLIKISSEDVTYEDDDVEETDDFELGIRREKRR